MKNLVDGEVFSHGPVYVLLRVTPIAGATLHDCRVAAAKLALEYNCTVEFAHDATGYRVAPNELVAQVKEMQ